MTDSVISVFDRLVGAEPPPAAPVRFDTACVLGGSVAGLLAARVLSDHARKVVIVERDEATTAGVSRPGVPQDRQAHTLLPSGVRWIERWLPGFSRKAEDLGAVIIEVDRSVTYFDGHPQARTGAELRMLLATRPLLEARIRAEVTALPNVAVKQAQATGLKYHDGAVTAVSYVRGGVEGVLDTDFVVDAMGRSSRLSDWVQQDGYDRPHLERLASPINYASALFERSNKAADLDVPDALAIFTQASPSGVSIAAASAVEDEQWLVMLMGYGQDRPGRTIDEFRAACAELPPAFGQATSGAVTRDIVTYHQAESRRRHFADVRQFPARLVSVGDAVASFNPVYGQGMSSAALHASCLSSYLNGDSDFNSTAMEFFGLQETVVDAAWGVSAGGDAARLDVVNGTEVPEEVRQQRWAMGQIVGATVMDGAIGEAFNSVSFMLRHPATLADPALLERALTANRATPDA